jgi:hypothetical protein
MKNLSILLCCMLLFIIHANSQVLGVKLDAEPDGICEDDTVRLSAVVQWGKLGTEEAYFWSSSTSVAFVYSSSKKVAKARITETTEFVVWVKDLDLKNPDGSEIWVSDTIKVNVTKRPDFIPMRDTSLCIDQALALNPDAGGYDSLVWSTTGKGSIDKPKETHAKYSPAAGEKGLIKIFFTAYGYDFCDIIKDTLLLTYYEKPVIGITPPPKSSICSTDTFKATYTIQNFTSKKWSVDIGKGSLIDVNGTIKYVPAPSEYGPIKLTLDAFMGGCQASATISFTVSQLTIEVFPFPPEFCKGEFSILCVSPCPGCKYKWSNGDTLSCIKLTPDKDMTYTINVTNTAGCTKTETVSIKVLPSPPTPIITESIPEKKITVGPSGMEKYTFIIKGVIKQSEKLKNEFYWEPYMKEADSVNIEITNIYGCTSDTVYYFPELICVDAFSPNGDGLNDLLLPGRKTIVFDRTEKILYQGWEGWDGRLNGGKELPEGTYFYILFDENNKVFCKQPVTLLRKIQ